MYVSRLRHGLALAGLGLGALSSLPAAAAAAPIPCSTANIAVTPLQSNVFYVDTTSNYLGSYVGYKSGNSGSFDRSGLWARLENFTGSVITPVGIRSSASDHNICWPSVSWAWSR